MLSDATFVQATIEYNDFDAPVPAYCFRRSLTVETETTATLRVAVCGFYDLWLNGEKITRGYLAPYISDPDHWIYADEYAVCLNAGENVIGLILGNGFQNNPGGYIWDFDKAPFRSAPKFALKVWDGEGCPLLVSDTAWKIAPSAILADDYRFGVRYDARREIRGWNLPGFDDSDWASPLEAEVPKGEIRVADVAPIVAEKEIKPVSITRSGNGFIYDFGENNAGICRLRIQGEAGQTVELRHAEEVVGGDIRLDNVWSVNEFWERDRQIVHLDTYTCRGEGEEVYEPAFTYHGFRYVRVDGITEAQATPKLLTYVVLHTDLHTRGDFTCSDEIANKVQENARRSILSNFHHFPTDCPQREKNGWTGDAAVSAEAAMLNFDPERNYREWMRNICKAQNQEGRLPGIVPAGGWPAAWGMNGPAWDCVLVWLPYLAYVYRGETAMIEESVPTFMAYLKYIRTRADERGLMHIGLGDWCFTRLENPNAPLPVTDTIISMDIANKIAFMLDAVGMTAEASFARGEAALYRNAFRTNLINFDTMMVDGKCQTAQAMALYYGVFEASETETAFARLVELVHGFTDYMDVGILGGRVIFHVLSEHGQADLAWKMAIENDWPSYGDCVHKGATTLWENFCPKGITRIPLSLNHHFWGDISAWFIKAVAGIRVNPDGRNLNHVEIKPSFITKLDHASAYYDAPAGRVASSWKRDGEAIEMTLEIPATMDATLVLGDGWCFSDGETTQTVQSDTYRIERRTAQ